MGIMKIFRPFAAAMLPTFNWPWLAVWIQTIVIPAGTLFVPVNAVLKWMAMALICDLVTGVLCRLKGFQRPNIHLIGVGVMAGCYSLAQYLARQPELQWEVFGRTFGIGEFFGLWCLTIHLGSFAKNMDDLGAPLPKGLKRLIAGVQSSMDNAEIGGSIISVFKSSLSQKSDTKEITTTTETTVVEKKQEPV